MTISFRPVQSSVSAESTQSLETMVLPETEVTPTPLTPACRKSFGFKRTSLLLGFGSAHVDRANGPVTVMSVGVMTPDVSVSEMICWLQIRSSSSEANTAQSTIPASAGQMTLLIVKLFVLVPEGTFTMIISDGGVHTPSAFRPQIATR